MNLKNYLNNDISIIDELPNNNLLTEAGLARLIKKMYQENNDFAVISAYRNMYSKKENIQRNRKLRTEFNKRKMGVYQLIGHWQECSLENVEYEKCPKDKLVDVIERSYLVIRPDNISKDGFKELIRKLTDDFKQDASVICLYAKIFIIEPSGKMEKIGNDITLNKINQAYSQFVKNLYVPFVFEAELPSSNSGKMVFKQNMILYPKNYKIDEVREF